MDSLIANIGLILGLISSCITIYQVLPKKRAKSLHPPAQTYPAGTAKTPSSPSHRTFSWISFTSAFLAVVFFTIAVFLYGVGVNLLKFLFYDTLHLMTITNGEFLLVMAVVAILFGLVFGRLGAKRNIR